MGSSCNGLGRIETEAWRKGGSTGLCMKEDEERAGGVKSAYAEGEVHVSHEQKRTNQELEYGVTINMQDSLKVAERDDTVAKIAPYTKKSGENKNEKTNTNKCIARMYGNKNNMGDEGEKNEDADCEEREVEHAGNDVTYVNMQLVEREVQQQEVSYVKKHNVNMRNSDFHQQLEKRQTQQENGADRVVRQELMENDHNTNMNITVLCLEPDRVAENQKHSIKKAIECDCTVENEVMRCEYSGLNARHAFMVQKTSTLDGKCLYGFSESKKEKRNEGGRQKCYEKREATTERESGKCEVEHVYNDQENEESCDGGGARENAKCITEQVNSISEVGKKVKKKGGKNNNLMNSE